MEHVEGLNDAIEDFVHVVLEYVVKDGNVREELREMVIASLGANLQEGLEELEKLCDDERQQPTTYSHYFMDNIQKARQRSTQAIVQNALDHI